MGNEFLDKCPAPKWLIDSIDNIPGLLVEGRKEALRMICKEFGYWFKKNKNKVDR